LKGCEGCANAHQHGCMWCSCPEFHLRGSCVHCLNHLVAVDTPSVFAIFAVSEPGVSVHGRAHHPSRQLSTSFGGHPAGGDSSTPAPYPPFVLETALLCFVTSRVVAHNIALFDSADACRTHARGFHALSAHCAERCARMFARSVIPLFCRMCLNLV
jgi:hypothetical protein